MPPSLNDFVGPQQDRCRQLDADCLGDLQVFGTMMCPFQRRTQDTSCPSSIHFSTATQQCWLLAHSLSSSGSLAMLTAIRRASSKVNCLASTASLSVERA